MVSAKTATVTAADQPWIQPRMFITSVYSDGWCPTTKPRSPCRVSCAVIRSPCLCPITCLPLTRDAVTAVGGTVTPATVSTRLVGLALVVRAASLGIYFANPAAVVT